MDKKSQSNFLSYISKKPRFCVKIIISFLIIAIYFLVYFSGGIKYVYSHTMYIPILISGFILGYKWGIIFGIFGGLMLGPIMPLDTLTGEKQEFFNWLFRLLMFVTIGTLSGIAANLLNKNKNTIANLFSLNPETEIPNTNILNQIVMKSFNMEQHILITILVNNHDKIIEILGPKIYHQLLKQIYVNLKNGLSPDSIIAQSDSNKFWLAITDLNVDEAVECVIGLLKQQIKIDDIPLYIDFAVGASVAKSSLESLDYSSYFYSDLAAKHAQKKYLDYSIYDGKQKYQHRDLTLLGIFTQALAEDQTFLVYQPKVDLKSLKTIGFEALIRWNHPKHGIIPPDFFIPMVEETQLINNLTEWVLSKVVSMIKDNNIEIPISINASIKNLFNEDFRKKMDLILQEANVSPNLIELEIVETMLMNYPDEGKNILNNLREKGYIISMDDFGKGYSSLSYISQFSINNVKIDKYFSQNLVNDPTIQHIVQAIISIAHHEDYRVIAEGIENEEVLNLLREYGCDYGQGFYFSKPLSYNDTLKWYNNDKASRK